MWFRQYIYKRPKDVLVHSTSNSIVESAVHVSHWYIDGFQRHCPKSCISSEARMKTLRTQREADPEKKPPFSITAFGGPSYCLAPAPLSLQSARSVPSGSSERFWHCFPASRQQGPAGRTSWLCYRWVNQGPAHAGSS